jgi:predicted O-methyltransferase YrrM/tetratricopeptide (TPR) repeat protein
MVLIDNKSYRVNAGEYENIIHDTYNNLKMHGELALHERLIGLIRKCATIPEIGRFRFFSFNTSHGGFMPIKVAEDNNIHEVYIIETNDAHLQNITDNVSDLEYGSLQKNKIFFDFSAKSLMFLRFVDIVYVETQENISNYLDLIQSTEQIIVCNEEITDLGVLEGFASFRLSNSPVYIYVKKDLKDDFEEVFKYYIGASSSSTDTPTEITYDNLVNLCIMVKNGGQQFEQMLLDNLHVVDKWTILDTGSTDDTIEVINRVLVGKKEGALYEEPFINFRDSRNRLLELAGTDCKYNLMLDDTYVIKGDLRTFLSTIRSDQYATSFTLFIQSEDTKYGSNRVIKSHAGLQYIYKIHEVISDKNNINVVIPEKNAYIEDRRFDYMERRTNDRKLLDLKLLYEEVEDDRNNPRSYYYLAQTYNCLGDYEKAFYYFMKRCEFINAGFLQERVDAAFEAARIANFKLNKPWPECEKLYMNAFKIDESRPEALYFIGIHYYLENNHRKAYKYLKQGFEIGFPEHCQYSLKPTLSFHFLPKFLTRVCYFIEDYLLGEKASEFFLLNNNSTAEDYEEIMSWYQIYKKINIYKGSKVPIHTEKPIFCFVADGGFHPWSGSNLITTGVGGSETYIIEMARYIKKLSSFDVYVFCNTPEKKEENFEGVIYRHLDTYYEFINTHYVKHVIVSRFSEYLPVTFKGFTENVYFVIHDLTPSGVVIPKDIKLKNIFCLTEWHVSYFTNIFQSLVNITVPFYYGIDNKFKIDVDIGGIEQPIKVKNKFIYSSFPNRGLLQLLQMWQTIHDRYPTSTLHIYADVNNKWSNDVEPEKMALIRRLLAQYKTQENGLGINYHGWVSKKELAESWLTADIWFYPCTFMETFCLTALEAASSKTLCVTNDLAALQNTVGNRGIIVPGDATIEEWQKTALEKLFEIMDDANVDKKNEIINVNYEWSKTLSWQSQAQKMLSKHILPNNTFEYKGMYNWTNDLPPGAKDIFLSVISHFNNTNHKVKFGKKVSVLEIGTYAGMSLIELIKLIPNSVGVGVDMWSNYNENKLLSVVDNYGVRQSFYSNIKQANLEDRITGIQIDSTTALIEFIRDERKFDFIYVDGSHLLLYCYTDLVLSWHILEQGGILAIDDYLYKSDEGDVLQSPYEGVNHFLKLFEGRYKVLDIGYRVFLEKIM